MFCYISLCDIFILTEVMFNLLRWKVKFVSSLGSFADLPGDVVSIEEKCWYTIYGHVAMLIRIK